MSKICQITGKRPLHGYRRSHAMNSSKRWFKPNVHSHRFWIGSKKKFYSFQISAKGMRTIDKLGVEHLLLLSDNKKKFK